MPPAEIDELKGQAEIALPDPGQLHAVFKALPHGSRAKDLTAHINMKAGQTHLLQAAQKSAVRLQAFFIFAEFVGQPGMYGRRNSRAIGKIRTDAQTRRDAPAHSGADPVDFAQFGI